MTVSKEIYQDIAGRTGGNIYIGVVGPVRTGKSTFIKNFMEALVLPAITSDAARSRARDELPQSGSGRTITTSEPKFVPEQAVELALEGVKVRVRLADCVGYMVEGALGGEENGEERLVDTPWFDNAVALTAAAEEGTRRVMREHATVGIVITSDGSITDLPREAYEKAEGEILSEMSASGKPYLLLVNSKAPASPTAQAVCESLTNRYGIPALAVDVLHMGSGEICDILRSLLFEFPLGDLSFDLPGYLADLPMTHPVKRDLCDLLLGAADGIRVIRELERLPSLLLDCPQLENAALSDISLSDGSARIALTPPRSLFFELLSESLPDGYRVTSDEALLPLLRDLADFKEKYSRYTASLEEAFATGYSMITPDVTELKLEEPEIVRRGGRFGVKLSASAPSLHLMLTNIESTVCPMVGSEKQSEELVDYLLGEFEDDPQKLWASNIFGKSLSDLINDGLSAKLAHVSGETGQNFRGTLERVINEGSG
ncbi:MAG: stage IV sporulation protein A, partial [Clostridia bacterium]|nr:stage IV sporulation protein A [Clostridia bacterium]